MKVITYVSQKCSTTPKEMTQFNNTPDDLLLLFIVPQSVVERFHVLPIGVSKHASFSPRLISFWSCHKITSQCVKAAREL